jgi:hypothetical protein
MTIFWDLDGCVRFLDRVFLGHEANEWYEKDQDGKDMCEVFNADTALTLIGEPTEYLSVANSQKEIRFLTAQPATWQKYAQIWLKRYITTRYMTAYTENGPDKLNWLEPGDYLVEDHPLLPCYDQVILIDRAYNRNVKCPIRVKTPKELAFVIREISDMGY